jgi:anti-sigma factor RsiW
MTGRVDPAETLAYVDDCLEPEARRDFEARLTTDPELRREVALWESQNRAIRAAFGAPPRGALDLGGVINENGARRAGQAARSADDAARISGIARKPRQATCPVAKRRPPSGPGPTARRLVGALALTAALVCVGLPSVGPRPPAALFAAGAAAARALAHLPVEFAADDPAALAQRLGPRLALAPPLAPGLQLVGARLAPGSRATATLYLYDDARGERVTLLVEPLDEIAATPPQRGEIDGLSVAAWTGAGYGFAAAAADDADVAALIAAAGVDDDSLAGAGAQRR